MRVLTSRRLPAVPALAWALLATVPALAQPPAGLATRQEICAAARAAVPHVAPAALDSLLNAGADLVVLDVRTEREWEAGHIGGAVWLPRGLLEFKTQELVPDPERRIVVYCERGCRGSLAAAALLRVGYRNVQDLEGGAAGWAKAGLPFYNALGRITVAEFGAPEPPAPVLATPAAATPTPGRGAGSPEAH